MKRILTMIALAVLTVGLTGSCTKNTEDRLDKTDASVAELKAAIGQYEKLQSDITAVIQTLRAEVGNRPASEQRTIWDCINALQNQKGTFEAAIAALQELVGDDAVSVQIDDAVAELISEYNLDSLAADIQAIRDKLNEKSGISALADQVAQLQKRAESIARILSVIGAYEDMIQSVRINPTCADGSVKAEDGIVSFTFTVTPAEALNGVKNLAKCLKLYADKVEVLTKAGAFSEIPVIKAEIIDKAKGEVRVEADLTKFLPEEKTEALSIALNVKSGVNDYTTAFVTVTMTLPPKGALSGKFTVAEGKQVYFSQGNLWADGSNVLHFEDAQWKSTPTSDGYKDASHISHFTWSSTVEAAVGDNNSGDYLFCNESHKVSVDGRDAIYYALSKDEWRYLFDYRTMTNGKNRYSKAMSGVIIGGATYKGVFLYPDNYNGEGVSSSMSWNDINAAGIVFLPAAGYYSVDFDVFSVGVYGRYWSSTTYDTDNAYETFFNEQFVSPSYNYRRLGFSVRLVTDVE